MTEEQYINGIRERIFESNFQSNVDLKQKCPLDNSKNSKDPQHDLSIFDRLPLELQQTVLNQVDLQTLVDFRRFNRCLLQVVDSTPDFRNII